MEVVALLLANPEFRSLVESLAVKVVAEIFHRRAVDPAYLAKSDAAFAAHASATTDEEKQNALKGLQSLFASQ